jgi:hypothetical protein
MCKPTGRSSRVNRQLEMDHTTMTTFYGGQADKSGIQDCIQESHLEGISIAFMWRGLDWIYVTFSQLLENKTRMTQPTLAPEY